MDGRSQEYFYNKQNKEIAFDHIFLVYTVISGLRSKIFFFQIKGSDGRSCFKWRKTA